MRPRTRPEAAVSDKLIAGISMNETSSALSQEAIDAMLNSQASEETDEKDASVEDAPAPEPIAEVEETAAASETADSEQPEPEIAEQPADEAAEPEASGSAEPEPSEPEATTEPVTVSAVSLASLDLEEDGDDEPAPVTVNAPPPPGVTPPPGVVHAEQPPGVADEEIEERFRTIADEIASSVIGSMQGELSALSQRITALESIESRISAIEANIAGLPTGESTDGLSLEELMPLIERLKALEKGAKNSPLFNLYEKFTCSSCESHGAAQARTRCGNCGKEGWFGRRQAA